MIIEKSQPNVPHGNTAFCGGALRRVSREYPATKYFADIMKVSQGQADEDLTKITIRNSRRAKANLSRLGIRWTLPTSNPGRADSVVGKGVTLAPALRKAVKKTKIPILYETKLTDISLSNGSLRSVKVQTKTGTETIPCKAVVHLNRRISGRSQTRDAVYWHGCSPARAQGIPKKHRRRTQNSREVGSSPHWHGGLPWRHHSLRL